MLLRYIVIYLCSFFIFVLRCCGCSEICIRHEHMFLKMTTQLWQVSIIIQHTLRTRVLPDNIYILQLFTYPFTTVFVYLFIFFIITFSQFIYFSVYAFVRNVTFYRNVIIVLCLSACFLNFCVLKKKILLLLLLLLLLSSLCLS